MSTVVAVLNRNGAGAEPGSAERMLAARPERAPDGCDAWQDGPVALGHGRFRVTPEERDERQPLVDGALVLAADLRLDNREELGALLGLSAAEVAALSDARLLLLAYRRWGEDCLPRLLGDFAFALWDGERQRLFAARDPLGERALCYAITAERCVFGSEISNVLAHPAVAPRIDEDAVAAFLAARYDSATETLYQGITYLSPGHGLTADAGGVRQWRYWAIEPQRTIRYPSMAEYAEHYLELLTDAVGRRLRSTAPVGISLSGGLDSTAVAALAAPRLAESGRGPLRSFSYAFDELTEADERAYIRLMVERYPIAPTYVNCDDAWPLKDLAEWPASRDHLLADPFTGMPQRLMRAAGEAGVRVLLTGYFGDVLFTGGNYWALDLFRDGRWGELARETAANARRIRWQDTFFEFGLRRLIPVSASAAYRRRRPRRAESVAAGISGDLVRRTNLSERLSPGAEERAGWPPGRWERYRGMSPEMNSQAYPAVRYQYNQCGVDVAQPYYDRRLVEFVMAVPGYILGGPDYGRRLHRAAMQGILPEAIRLRRDRTTFAGLALRGLQEREWGKVQQIMSRPQVVERGYIDGDWLRGRLAAEFDLSADSMLLWRALCLELWLQRYWS